MLNRSRALADRQNLALKSEFKEEQLLVKADKERIRQVIINLVHNAIKFSRPGETITALTKEKAGMAAITIADQGIGIPKDDLSHIFVRFYKADKSRSGQGPGMGLAIAKHLVQAHGGNILPPAKKAKALPLHSHTAAGITPLSDTIHNRIGQYLISFKFCSV